MQTFAMNDVIHDYERMIFDGRRVMAECEAFGDCEETRRALDLLDQREAHLLRIIDALRTTEIRIA